MQSNRRALICGLAALALAMAFTLGVLAPKPANPPRQPIPTPAYVTVSP